MRVPLSPARTLPGNESDRGTAWIPQLPCSVTLTKKSEQSALLEVEATEKQDEDEYPEVEKRNDAQRALPQACLVFLHEAHRTCGATAEVDPLRH